MTGIEVPAGAGRPALVRRGLLLVAASVAWMAVEGVVSLTAGATSRSVALLGFGVDSVIEIGSALVVGWRLREEARGACPERLEQVERKAARAAGALLLAVALYLLLEAGAQLMGLASRAGESRSGLAITALALVVMPLLARGRLHVAEQLGSRALRADAMEAVCCAWLSATALVGLGLNAAFGWWWADPVAGLVLVPLLVREGLASWRGAPCGACTCKGD